MHAHALQLISIHLVLYHTSRLIKFLAMARRARPNARQRCQHMCAARVPPPRSSGPGADSESTSGSPSRR